MISQKFNVCSCHLAKSLKSIYRGRVGVDSPMPGLGCLASTVTHHTHTHAHAHAHARGVGEWAQCGAMMAHLALRTLASPGTCDSIFEQHEQDQIKEEASKTEFF